MELGVRYPHWAEYPTSWWISKPRKLYEQIYGDDLAVAGRVRRLSIYYSTTNDWVGMSKI